MSDAIFTEAAPSVLHFAEDLIRNFHPHLQDARIAFVFRKEAQKQGDWMILGQCSKVPAKFAPLFEYDFLIWISQEDWEGMDDLSREALIDHELCHAKRNPLTLEWGIRPHDIQEFADVISRHGVWSPDIIRVKQAIDQYEMQTLPGFVEKSMNNLFTAAEKVGAEVSIGAGGGRVVTLTGDQLDRAAKALAEP